LKNPPLQISKILARKVEFRPLETEPKYVVANHLQLHRTKRKERLTMAVMLFLIGLVIGGIGALWLIFVAFKQNPQWGLGVLFIPGVFLIFGIKYWQNASKPFVIMLIGAALLIAGRLLMPHAA
jgi:FtsH-binding integral membrane protein